MDLSALTTLQRDGVDVVEVDGLSRVLEIEGELLFGRALEHRQETLHRVDGGGHECSTMGILDGRELLLERTGLDADAKLIKVLGRQEDDGGCCGRHFCDRV